MRLREQRDRRQDSVGIVAWDAGLFLGFALGAVGAPLKLRCIPRPLSLSSVYRVLHELFFRRVLQPLPMPLDFRPLGIVQHDRLSGSDFWGEQR